jgi:hypothetical protein
MDRATPRNPPLLRAALAFALVTAAALAGETMPARLYEVTTETGMPHLEENLRYTTTRERHCLAHQALASAFPILSHPALQGCTLNQARREHDTVSYLLVCEGGHGTTGNAVWHLDAHRIRGTLNVKLGGKNMTFYQRVTATPVGECTQ